MASATSSSFSGKESKEAANRSKLSSSLKKLYGKDFSWEQMSYITHHANFCHDFDALRENFNSQFNTNRTLDSIDDFLRHCGNEDFFNISQDADRYQKWYTEHPIKPGHPPILLGSRAMRTELRAFLAYHHHRGMDFSDLKKSFNLTFPTEARNSRQLTAQLNHLKKDNHLFKSLTNFAARYSWYPKYEETITPAKNARNPAASRGTAKTRLRQGKQKPETLKNSAAAKAAQMQVLSQSVGSGEGSLAAEKEPVSNYTNPNPTGNVTLGLGVSFQPTTGAITGRPRHSVGRARSASPATRGAGEFTRERRGSF